MIRAPAGADVSSRNVVEVEMDGVEARRIADALERIAKVLENKQKRETQVLPPAKGPDERELSRYES